MFAIFVFYGLLFLSSSKDYDIAKFLIVHFLPSHWLCPAHLQDELEATEKNASQYVRLEKRYAEVSSEAKALQGELTDLNLVLDCAASETSLLALR